METSHKEICWGLVLVIGTKSLANLSLASVAQGRIISHNRQVKKRKRERPAEETENRRAVDRHREQASGGQTQRTGERWTDTQIATHTDRKKKKQRNR